MRKGSVALVPLFLAIVVLFWFIAFMGGANDNLHAVNNVENLRHLQGKLLLSAMKHRYDLEAEAKAQGTSLSEAELNQRVNGYINFMMVQNKVQQSINNENTGGMNNGNNMDNMNNNGGMNR